MSMEHNKHPAENIEFLEQASSEFAKEEKEPEIQTEKIHKPNVEESEAIVTSGDESPFPVRMFPYKRRFSDDSSTDSSDVSDSEAIAEEESKEPEIQTEEIPKPNVEESESPFPVRMVPYNRYFSDDSSTDSSYFSDSASDSEAIAEEESKEPEIQTEETPKPNVEESEAIVTSDDEPPFPVRMVPYNRHFSDDSSTDSSYFSDSDETIAEEESKINKENSTKDRDNQTATEPLKESKINKENSPEKQLKFDYDPETQAIQLAKSSTTELMSGPTVLTSSILVKHGTKRPVEAEVGDEESKRAKKLALSNSTIENVKN